MSNGKCLPIRIEQHLSKGSWATAAQLFQLVYGVAAVFLIIRVISPNEFGSYVLAQGIIQIISMVGGATVYRQMVRELSKESWDRSLPANSFLLSLLLQSLLLAPFYLFRVQIAALLNAPLLSDLLTLIVPLYLSAMFLKTFPQKIIISKRTPNLLFLANGTYFLFLIAGLVYLNIIGELRTAKQVLMLSTISAFASAVVGWLLSLDLLRRVKIEISAQHFRKILSFGKYSLGAATANTIASRVDSYVISYLLGPLQVAYYNSAKFIYKFYQTISQVLDVTLFPYGSKLASENRLEDLKVLYEKIVCFIYIVLIPVNVAALFLAKPLMTFIYEGRYEGSYVVLQILIVTATFLPISSIGAFLAFALDKPKLVLYARVINLSTVLLFGFILIDRVGIAGMAVALSLGVVVQSVYLTAVIRKHLPVSLIGVLSRTKDVYHFLRKLV